MPRITPLRVLLFVPAFYLLLIALWVILPFPDVPWGTDTVGKTEDRLNKGGTITRVYNVGDFFSYYDQTPSVVEARSSHRRSFALDFAFNASTGALTLRGYHSSHIFDLPALISSTSDANNGSTYSYMSEPITILAKAGDQDGINLPFFSFADSTLLFWGIHSADVVNLPLRIAVLAETQHVQVLADGKSPQRGTPLLSLLIDPTHLSHSVVNAIWPAPDLKPNSSPSRTFLLRRAIQTVLVPTWFFFADVVVPLIGAPILILSAVITVGPWAALVFIVVVLACFKASRTRAFWPWARTFWLTRGLVRYVGATIGPGSSPDNGEVGEVDGSEEEASDIALTGGPQPLTSAWAFFTSSSPLDDLLVTFEATKPLVQPMSSGLRRRRTEDLERQVEHAGSGESKEQNEEKGSGAGSALKP